MSRLMALRIAIPSKGRLTQDALDILRRVGIRLSSLQGRTLLLPAEGGRYHILASRAQDIPEFVEAGAADAGITGLDLVEESGCRVRRRCDLDFGHCRLVVAAPETKRFSSLDDLPAHARVATSFPRLTRAFFEARKMTVNVVPVSGAAEITPYIGLADAITDLVQTGETLRQNHLTLLDVVLDSRAVLIVGDHVSGPKAALVDELAHALEAVRAAEKKRYLMANLSSDRVADAGRVIPGLGGPTVTPLSVPGMVAVHAVVSEDDLNGVIPKLREIGATGILVLPIERLVE